MLARLQRTWVALLLLLAGGAGTLAFTRGAPWWTALLLALVIVHVHAFVLALEFAVLGRVDPGIGVPRPTADMLLRAWWGEVWTGFAVFGWRQPFRSRANPDEPPDEVNHAHRPVLLVHGFVCNRGLWNPWMQRLALARVPFVAVNLEPVFGSIDSYVPIIDAAIARLQSASPHKPLIVAHSMGGLATRAWMARHDGARRIHSVVTIGTPHAGTLMAAIGYSLNARQMRRESNWLAALTSAETDATRALFTCYFSHCDNIVVPASTATLPGADNRHVPGVAHVHLAFQPQVFEDVLERTRVMPQEWSNPAGHQGAAR